MAPAAPGEVARSRDGVAGADPVEEAPSAPRLALVCGLLFAVIALMILLPRGPGARSVLTLFIGCALLVAVTAARVPRVWVVRISVLVALTAVVSIAMIWDFGDTGTTAGLGMTTLLVVAVPCAILSALRDARKVSIQAVFGAIAVYLIVGLAFALAANLAARISGEPYFTQTHTASLSQYVYFSYVTLATLGYGDLTPATAVGRLLSVFETIAGSLYLVTAVSLIVSRVGAERPGRGP
ncbi:MAG TPA: potassium channel family protein [Gaiellales bacterium]